MAKEIRNIGASVRARLLNLSKTSGQSFDLVLTRFALERLLFRLGRSAHAARTPDGKIAVALSRAKAARPSHSPHICLWRSS